MHAEFFDANNNKKSHIITKFRYISQTKTRPPTFSLYCNTKKKLNLSKIRSFKNRLRNKFGLEGIPIRINLKVSKNPYKKN
jgi:GTP-binding protein